MTPEGVISLFVAVHLHAALLVPARCSLGDYLFAGEGALAGSCSLVRRSSPADDHLQHGIGFKHKSRSASVCLNAAGLIAHFFVRLRCFGDGDLVQ